ncbi:MAG: cell division protein FtsH, partial [Gemmatimonadales bacterium]
VMSVGDREQEIFLGREFAHRREISERTAEIVDEEVKRLVDEAYEKARGLLTEYRELLDRMAAALLERETLDREDLDTLVAGKALPPKPIPPSTPPAAQPLKPGATPARQPGVLGAPPAEPAGA